MNQKLPLKVIFFGSPEFVLDALDSLHQSSHIELSLVVSNIDKPAGRGQKLTSPPVIEYCKKNSIPFHQSENINKDEVLTQILNQLQPDLFIVFAFSHFLSEKLLNLPKVGAFNIHTSLLPKYRGSSPIHYALLNGDKLTGVSIQKMVKKMDAGDIYYTMECLIEPKDDFLTLSHKLKSLSKTALNNFINKLEISQLSPVTQDESRVTFAPLIKKEDGLIDFKKLSAIQISNCFRAYKLWPGIFTYLQNQIVKILDCEPLEGSLRPAELKIVNHKLLAGCAEGILQINKLQFPNKSPISSLDYINGSRADVPKTIGETNENN
jgi:methionyl-tRNA formyltransferase